MSVTQPNVSIFYSKQTRKGLSVTSFSQSIPNCKLTEKKEKDPSTVQLRTFLIQDTYKYIYIKAILQTVS